MSDPRPGLRRTELRRSGFLERREPLPKLSRADKARRVAEMEKERVRMAGQEKG